MSAFVLCRLMARRRGKSAPAAADRTTQPLAPPIAVASSPQEPSATDGPALSQVHVPQADAAGLFQASGPVCVAEGETAVAVAVCPVAADPLPVTGGSPCCDGQPAAQPPTVATANSKTADAAVPDASGEEEGQPHITFPDDQDAMRITKRSSGGRGEYEISETFGPMTPRDLLDHALVLDFGEGVQVPTGVLLLDRNGKRRLRIDSSSGAEIHLHRQLAAALLMPHPARDEHNWGAGQPVLQSGLYGIGNISLSDVQLIQGGRARLAPERIDVANSDHREQLSCPRRFAEVRALWAARDVFPPAIAQLLAEHEQLVRRGRPLGEHLEEIVTRIQQALAAQNGAALVADPLPSLLQMIEASRSRPSATEAAHTRNDQQASQDRAAATPPAEAPASAPPVPEAEAPTLPGNSAVQEEASPLPAAAEEPAAVLPPHAQEEQVALPEEPQPTPVSLAATGPVETPAGQHTEAAPAETAAEEQEAQSSGGVALPMPQTAANQVTAIEQQPGDASKGPGTVGEYPAPLPAPAPSAATKPASEPAAPAEEDDEGPEATEEEEITPPGPSPVIPPARPRHPRAPRRRPTRPEKNKIPPVPHRYQPSQRGGTTARRTTTDTENGEETAGASIERPAPIELHFRKQRGGMVAVSLLPRRREGMPAVIDVLGAGPSPFTLSAVRDDWYQDVVPADLGTVLRTGAEWYADTKDGRLRWSLAGRDLYILGNSDEWSGPVSRPWLVLGDEHTVLCTEALIPQVEGLLRESCGTVPVRLAHDDGMPAGWVAYRPVTPTKPLPLGETPDFLDPLRPSPDIEIALRGGIRLHYSQWLASYPPAIRVYGDVEHAGALAIDGVAAVRQPDGSFTVAGWDAAGDHIVSCGGQTASYSIIKPADGWEAWTAYSFPSLAVQGREPGICGALVFSPAPDQAPRPPLLVPASNPILLGSVPGQIYRCPIQEDVHLPFCAAFPAFTPIWAVPADPLHADKATARVLLVGPLDAAGLTESIAEDASGRNIRQWCAVILDCSRKGLAIEPAGEEVAVAWRSCRNLARRIWRASR